MTTPQSLWPGGFKTALPRAVLIILLSMLAGVPNAPAATPAELDAVRTKVRQGELSQALSDLERLLQSNPKDPQLRFLKGVVLAESGQVDEAISAFLSLTQDFPELPEPHNNLAVLYASKGDYENARDALLIAINTHPSYATAHENLGDIYAKMARIAYDRALSLNTANRTAQAKLNLLRELFSVRDVPAAPSPTSTVAATGQPSRATKPAPSGAQRVESAIDTGAAISLVQRWADAWSRQDVSAYLGFYDPSFRPVSGLSRARWAKRRVSRLRRPRFIQVAVDNFDVKRRSAGQVAVTFTQAYQSDTYKDSVRKQLVLNARPDGLRIVSETTLP